MNTRRPWSARHPRLTMWAALATAMVAILLLAVRGKELLRADVAWMAAAVVLTAGACAWAIGLE